MRCVSPGVDTPVLIAQDVLVREAAGTDADAIAAIGSQAVPAQYAGLVDPAAVAAVVSQVYDPSAVTACIDRCRRASDGTFLVAERSRQVVGFLHFDSFGPEPELHRLYLDRRHRGAGIGTMLMNELHARLPAELAYMLLVVSGNDRAVRFYERHGLNVARIVDGLAYYSDRMGVVFPPDARPVGLVLMRRTVAGHHGRERQEQPWSV
jgi:ribosomal protein S18 acetylase RimI-like enzyme